MDRFKKYYSVGPLAGLFLLILVVFDIFLYIFLCWHTPENKIDKAISFPCKKYNENKEKYGNH